MPYSRREIIHILRSAAFQRAKGDRSRAHPLCEEAGQAARTVFGQTIYQRGVIEFSSQCDMACLYCGLRLPNTRLDRYTLSHADVLHAVDTAVQCGMGTIVLQSGQTAQPDPALIAELVSVIKSRHRVAVTLSLGEHPEDVYRLWRDSGADRYLLKIETTDEALHQRLRPGQTAATRLRHVERLQRLGFETGSGIISGLPGMTPDILAEDLIRLSSLGLEMLAVGPFIPHPDTPLGHSSRGCLTQALLAMAFLRLQNRGANIPATSALDSISPEGRILGLQAGANVIMPSFTPDTVRGAYSIYPGKNRPGSKAADIATALQQRVLSAGFELTNITGNSKTPLFSRLPRMLEGTL